MVRYADHRIAAIGYTPGVPNNILLPAWLQEIAPSRWPRGASVAAVVCGVALLAIAITNVFAEFRLDDAYITFRVAANLAAGHGLVYNVGEPTLTTTAPGYALLLAGIARLGFALPLAGKLLSAFAIAGTAWVVLDLGAGLPGAILVLVSPLLLGTLGMETTVQLFAVAFAILCARRGWSAGVGLALMAAVALRPDGAVPAVIVGMYALVGSVRRGVRQGLITVVCLLFGASLAAFLYVWIWRVFGSPFPATLAAKVIQRSLGFYGYVEGMRVWFDQSALPWWAMPIIGPLVALGIVATFARRFHWNFLFIAWAVVHSAAYVCLDVAGYYWYYAPVALAVATTVGIGVQCCVAVIARPASSRTRPSSASRAHDERAQDTHEQHTWNAVPNASLVVLSLVGILCGVGALSSLVLADVALVRGLPDARSSLYARAGTWLATQTPRNSTIGVMEVGIMGFYAERTMIDFAGLTRPATVDALGRGDMFWTIAHYEPDYLVLTNKNPLYSYDIQDDAWFLQSYQPETGFRDDRWFGSPVTIFRRHDGPAIAPVRASVNAQYGNVANLGEYQLDRSASVPGQFIRLTAYWHRTGAASGTWKLFAHIIDAKYKVYSGSDVEVYPTKWPINETIETNQFVQVPLGIAEGTYLIELGWYNPSTLKRLPVTNAQGKAAGETVVLHEIIVSQ
jgi:hypothetical protein